MENFLWGRSLDKAPFLGSRFMGVPCSHPFHAQSNHIKFWKPLMLPKEFLSLQTCPEQL